MSPVDQTQKSEAWQQALLPTGLVRVLVAVIKIPSTKQFGRKISLLPTVSHHSLSLREVGLRTQGRTEVEDVKGCCPLACSSLLALPAFLYYQGQSAQGWMSWAHPYLSLIKKMHHRLVSWRRFLNRGSLFPDDPTLNQVDKKLINIPTEPTLPD